MPASLFSQVKHLAVKNAPIALKVPTLLLPPSLQLKAIANMLNSLFSEAITEGDFDFLEQRWVQIEVKDLALVFHVSFNHGKLITAGHCSHVDLRFSAKTNDLILLMGRLEDPDSLFFQRRLLIEGDTEMGLEVKNVIDAIDFDTWPIPLQKCMQHLSFFVANNYPLASADL